MSFPTAVFGRDTAAGRPERPPESTRECTVPAGMRRAEYPGDRSRRFGGVAPLAEWEQGSEPDEVGRAAEFPLLSSDILERSRDARLGKSALRFAKRCSRRWRQPRSFRRPEVRREPSLAGPQPEEVLRRPELPQPSAPGPSRLASIERRVRPSNSPLWRRGRDGRPLSRPGYQGFDETHHQPLQTGSTTWQRLSRLRHHRSLPPRGRQQFVFVMRAPECSRCDRVVVPEGKSIRAHESSLRRAGRALRSVGHGASLRIPMMSISHSDPMPTRSERSDAGLSQGEAVIDIRQEFFFVSLSGCTGNLRQQHNFSMVCWLSTWACQRNRS